MSLNRVSKWKQGWTNDILNIMHTRVSYTGWIEISTFETKSNEQCAAWHQCAPHIHKSIVCDSLTTVIHMHISKAVVALNDNFLTPLIL